MLPRISAMLQDGLSANADSKASMGVGRSCSTNDMTNPAMPSAVASSRTVSDRGMRVAHRRSGDLWVEPIAHEQHFKAPAKAAVG
jgi:hypothetical protein